MPAKPRAPATRASGPAIAEAARAGDFVAALDGALLLWRRARQPAVADLIDAIGARCRPKPIGGKDSNEFQAIWLALAAKPEAVMVGALAASLGKRVPVRDVGYLTPNRDLKRQKAFLDRIAALSKLPPDPRVAAALIEVIEKAPYSESRRIYEPVIALLRELADERSIAALEQLIERPTAKGSAIRDYFAEALPAAVEEIAATERLTLSPTDDKAVVGLLAELGGSRGAAPHRDVQQLLAECLAKPDDDAPRAVLADALLEREDPRGELIALQLSGGDPKRVAALLRKHEKEWLGELHRVTKLRVWRRGFLDEAELQNHAVADDAAWARIANDPALATVRVLHKGRANADLYRAFVRSPAMRSLREVTVATAEQLQDLVTLTRPIDHVVLEPGLTKATFAHLGVLAGRGLRRLTFTARHTPETLIERVLDGFPAHTLFDELTVDPARGLATLWADEAPRWFAAHAALEPARRLGILFHTTRVIAEAGKTKPRLEIHASHDYSLEWVLGKIGPFERLVIRGSAPAELRPSLTAALAKLPSVKVELHDGWERLTDRNRARRARRS